jgi:hypothetical protein
MTNFAIFDIDGKITNTIVADSLEVVTAIFNKNCVELPEQGFGISDLYDGTQFIKVEVENAAV